MSDYLIPEFRDSKLTEQSKGQKPYLPDGTEMVAWKSALRKKEKGSKRIGISPSAEPVTRHDFSARKMYERTFEFEFCVAESAVKSVVLAAAMGPKNLRTQIEHTPPEFLANAISAGVSVRSSSVEAVSLGDVLLEAQHQGLVETVYRITDYDQVICAIDKVGPIVATIPWYEHFVDEFTIQTRVEKPWGDAFGWYSVVLSGYGANGMLLTCEHHEMGWPKPNFQIKEDDFTDLIRAGGEIFAFTKMPYDPEGITQPIFEGRPRATERSKS